MVAPSPPENTRSVLLIANKLAIQSMDPVLRSAYVDAQCDEGTHLSPVTDLSVIRPLEQKEMLI